MVIEGLYGVHACFMEFGTVNPETPAFGVLWLSRLSPSPRPVNSGPQFRTSWSYLVDDSFWGAQQCRAQRRWPLVPCMARRRHRWPLVVDLSGM